MKYILAQNETFQIISGELSTEIPLSSGIATQQQINDILSSKQDALTEDQLSAISSVTKLIKPTRIYNQNGDKALDNNGQLFKSQLEVGGHWEADLIDNQWPSYSGHYIFKYTGHDTISYTWTATNSNGLFIKLYSSGAGNSNGNISWGGQFHLSPSAIADVNPTNTASSQLIAGLHIGNNARNSISAVYYPQQIQMLDDPYGHFALESLPNNDFASQTSYVVGDLVKSNGKAYRCKVSYESTTTTPENDTTHWKEIQTLAQLDDVYTTSETSSAVEISSALQLSTTLSDAQYDQWICEPSTIEKDGISYVIEGFKVADKYLAIWPDGYSSDNDFVRPIEISNDIDIYEFAANSWSGNIPVTVTRKKFDAYQLGGQDDKLLAPISSIAALSAELSPLPAAIKSKIYIDDRIDNTISGNTDLSVIKLSKADYEQTVANATSDVSLSANVLYMIDSDYIDAYGQQIKNLSAGTNATDAVTVKQLEDSVEDKINIPTYDGTNQTYMTATDLTSPIYEFNKAGSHEWIASNKCLVYIRLQSTSSNITAYLHVNACPDYTIDPPNTEESHRICIVNVSTSGIIIPIFLNAEDHLWLTLRDNIGTVQYHIFNI